MIAIDFNFSFLKDKGNYLEKHKYLNDFIFIKTLKIEWTLIFAKLRNCAL